MMKRLNGLVDNPNKGTWDELFVKENLKGFHPLPTLLGRCLSAASALVVLSVSASVAQDETGRILALVNGIPIRAVDVQCVIEASPLNLLLPPTQGTGAEGGRSHPAEALDRLISIELLYQESLKHRYPGLSLEVEERYEREVARAGGETRLQDTLRCNDMTPASFKKSLFRNLSIYRYLEDHVFSKVAVSDEQALDYYNTHRSCFSVAPTVRVRQVLIRVPSWEDPQRVQAARNRADQVRQMAAAGADFEALARRFSDDPAGGARGGDIGLVTRGDPRFPFEREAFSLEVGGVSHPLPTRHGYVVMKVVERGQPTERSFEEVRPEIVSLLRQEAAAGLVTELLARLRASADIRFPEPAEGKAKPAH